MAGTRKKRTVHKSKDRGGVKLQPRPSQGRLRRGDDDLFTALSGRAGKKKAAVRKKAGTKGKTAGRKKKVARTARRGK